jgi:hypothetical protein
MDKFLLAVPGQAGAPIIILQRRPLGQVDNNPNWAGLDNKEESRTTPVPKTGQSAAVE